MVLGLAVRLISLLPISLNDVDPATDTIGCGIDFASNTAFYTKNGSLLGKFLLQRVPTTFFLTLTQDLYFPVLEITWSCTQLWGCNM